MRIGIDARLISETGVGRYIRNLIRGLAALDTVNEYVIFLTAKNFATFPLPNDRWKKVLANVRWHTVVEQLQFPGICIKEHLDILHVPYHNPPIFYPGTMIVTIHDLTILHFSTGKATTLPKPLYVLKRLGYTYELSVGLTRARHILTVSQATKRELMDHFGVAPDKISVIYEGVDPQLSKQQTRHASRDIEGAYFLAVGNAYPHKNLETLLEGYANYRSKVSDPARLILVGQDDYFYKRLRSYAQSRRIADGVVFYGPADDNALVDLYSHAVAFVFPSLMEGFGLPPLEALSLGCPVIASDISVFHEILGKYATYVEPKDPGSIAHALTAAASGKIRPFTRTEVASFLKQYSWKNLAKETLSAYERSVRV